MSCTLNFASLELWTSTCQHGCVSVMINVERNGVLLRTHVQGRQIFLPKDSWVQLFDSISMIDEHWSKK